LDSQAQPSSKLFPLPGDVMPSQPGTLNFGERALICRPLPAGVPHPRYSSSTALVLFGPVAVSGVCADFLSGASSC
jgi:hypothetical protein